MNPRSVGEADLWRAAGGDGTRGGLFPQPVRVSPRPARRLRASGAVQASVVFDRDGRGFVADMAGGVQAFSSRGDLLWRVKLTGGISATPVVHPTQPRLFVGTHSGGVWSLDTATGKTVWQREVPSDSDPRILSDLLQVPESNLIVLSSWGGRFRALDPASGAERFSWDAGISPGAAAAADRGGTIYSLRAVGNRGTELVRVSAEGAETVWHHVAEGQRGARRSLLAAAPVVDEARDAVYFVINQDRGGRLLAWSLRSQGVLWTCPLTNAVQATPTLRPDGGLLLPDLAGGMSVITAEGQLQSRLESGCEYLLAGGVCEPGGDFFLGDPWGRVQRIQASGSAATLFEAQRSFQARPSFGPDYGLYVPGTDRNVYVFPAVIS